MSFKSPSYRIRYIKNFKIDQGYCFEFRKVTVSFMEIFKILELSIYLGTILKFILILKAMIYGIDGNAVQNPRK